MDADTEKEARKAVTERVRESIKRDNAEIAQKQADAVRLQEQTDLRNLETDLRLKAQRTAAEKEAK